MYMYLPVYIYVLTLHNNESFLQVTAHCVVTSSTASPLAYEQGYKWYCSDTE